MNRSVWRRVAGVVALVLWISSLILPAVTECSDGRFWPEPGWSILLLGWLGPLIGQFGWFANLTMLWVTFRLIFQYPAGFLPGVLGFALALTSFFWTGTPGTGDGPTGTICQHNSGFYVWMACAALLCTMVFFELIPTRSTAKDPIEASPPSDNNDANPLRSENDAG